MKSSLSKETWETVLNELCEINVLRGIYDAEQGNKNTMFGINFVMEVIAYQAEKDEDFGTMFWDNVEISENRMKRRKHERKR